MSPLSMPVWRLMFVSQVLIVLVLMLLFSVMIGTIFMIYSNFSSYYENATPYVSEFSNRSLHILRRAEASAISLESVMTKTNAFTEVSIPDLIESVNKTTAVIQRVREMAQNPVLKLSMG